MMIDVPAVFDKVEEKVQRVAKQFFEGITSEHTAEILSLYLKNNLDRNEFEENLTCYLKNFGDMVAGFLKLDRLP